MTNKANGSAAKQHLEAAEDLLGRVQSGVDVMLNSSDGDVLSPYMTNCLKWIEESMNKAKAEIVACNESMGAGV